MRVRLEVEAASASRTTRQYINIVLEDGQKRAFSFATAPHEPGPIELHIRRIEAALHTHVFTAMKVATACASRARSARSSCARTATSRSSSWPCHGLRAGEEHGGARLPRRIARPMVLYWARAACRHVPARASRALAKEHPTSASCRCSPSPPGGPLEGRKGLVHEAILADYPDLAGHASMPAAR